MAYRNLTPEERAKKGAELADTLQRLDEELAAQSEAKKAMKAREGSLRAELSRLKGEVRSGKEWVEDQGTLELT